MKNLDFLKKMLEVPSPSGSEFEIQKLIINEMKDYDDKVFTHHNLNVVHAINTNSKVKVLLSGHVDEISLIVEEIRENGTIRVCANGGIRPYCYIGQHINVIHKDFNGKITKVPGIVTYLPEMQKGIETKNLIIDLGYDKKEDTEKVVTIGDPIIHESTYKELANNRFCARALDDRLGAFICLEAMKRVKEKGGKNGVYVSTTVGEETTYRGALAAADNIKPTCAIIVDVTYASDINYRENLTNPVALGKGPALTRGGSINDRLEQIVLNAANKLSIKTQFEVASSRTYTDLDGIFTSQGGIPSYLISIPLRYMHSAVEVCDLKDVEEIIQLITQVILDIKEDETFNLFDK